MNLSSRIIVLVVGLIGVVGIIIGGFTLMVTHRLVDEALTQKTQDVTQTLCSLSKPNLRDLRVNQLNFTIKDLRNDPTIAGLYIYDTQGLLLADGLAYPNLSHLSGEIPEVRAAVIDGRSIHLKTKDQRIQVEPILSPSGDPMGMVVVKLSRAEEHYWLNKRHYQVVLFVGLLIIAGALLAAQLSASLIRPLEVLTQELESTRTEFGPAFQKVERRRDEIGRLAQTYRKVESLRMEQQRDLESSRVALVNAKVAAEAAARAKSDFLANMSHEIRTPLNGLIGLNEILMKESPRPDQATLLHTAEACGKGLLAVVNDLLDYSKIDAGRVRLLPTPADFVAIAEDSLRLFQSQIRERSLETQLKIAENFPPRTLIDAQRVRQVIQNLISNAIKFTESGTITLGIDFRLKSENAVDLICSVTDTGLGIDPYHLTRIFERFAQADESTSRQYGGTGLGLAICNRLIEMMDGQLKVESELGQGSTFTFSIPSHILDTQMDVSDPIGEAETNANEPLESWRILVVEDNPVNRRVVTLMLRHLGQEPVVVENGKSAIEAVQQDDFDVILMDLQMPEMDGFETTRLIRATLPHDNLPFIIALTAYAQDSDRQRCLKSGMDDFVTKPLKRDDLNRLFSRLNIKLKDRGRKRKNAPKTR